MYVLFIHLAPLLECPFKVRNVGRMCVTGLNNVMLAPAVICTTPICEIKGGKWTAF
jgi:hypothetical protein